MASKLTKAQWKEFKRTRAAHLRELRDKMKSQKEIYRDYRERSCTSKVAFDSVEAAAESGMETYVCRFCGKWHRTGKRVREFKKILYAAKNAEGKSLKRGERLAQKKKFKRVD